MLELKVQEDAMQQQGSAEEAKVGQEASELEPEPGFILGLKALTDTLGRLWAERF